ncbi:rRNA maturation RNase YbeY [Candidatus Omnitrophota bacterium]
MKVSIKNLQRKIPVYPKRIKRAALKTLVSLGVNRPGEVAVFFVTEKRIRELNAKYLGQPCATDVICFDLARDRREIMADIFICTAAAVKNAKTYKTSTEGEIFLYLVHGLLHLLGYNDRTQKERKRMQRKEKRILECL